MHAWLKFEGYSSKNEAATPLRSSKLKWAWRAQFLSHNLQILWKFIFFESLQMIVKPSSWVYLHRVVSRVHFYSRLSTNRTWQCFILWYTRLYLHMGHDNVSFCVLAFASASAFGYCSNLICGPFSNLHSN